MKPVPLNDLAGHKLISVTFIHDYVQFGFEDRFILSVFNPMRFRQMERETDSSRPDFKDSLCSLIGHSVLRTGCRSEQEISFVFENDAMLIVGLGEKDFIGPEAIKLDDTAAGRTMVVRFGE